MKRPDSDQDMKLLLATAVFASATFFLFGPLQLYLANLSELWFGILDVLWSGLAALVLAGGVLTVLGVILRKHRRAFYGYVSLLWGLGLALYIQGNFLPNAYGLLNGETVEWAAYRKTVLLDALLWVGCLAVPFLLRVFLRSSYRSVLKYGACALFGIQLLATGMTCVTTELPDSTASGSYISDEGICEVSEEENIVVFVLDTFDQRFFDAVYEDDPGFMDFLDGFTYFNNSVSCYPATRGSVPYLLTGQYYENREPFEDYFAKAWPEGEYFYQTLMDDGYSINLYEDMGDQGVQTVLSQTPWVRNAVQAGLRVSSYVGLEKAIMRFTAMRFFPDGLKKYVWSQDDLFNGYRKAAKGQAEPFPWDSLLFYEKVKSQGLSVSEGKQYRYYHFDGMHVPYTILDDMTEDTTGLATSTTETRGELNILREYIRQLKELGVYDQTCLIVIGDHGYAETIKTNPVMLVKGFGDSGALRFSDAPVSHSNFRATILAELGEEVPDQWGESVFDVSEDAEPVRRYFQYALDREDWNTYFPDMLEYHILPDGNDEANYILTGNIYTPEGLIQNVPYGCTVGEPILFTNSESLSYFIYGLGYLNLDSLAWSTGKSGRACFNFGDVQSDLMAHIEIYEWVPADCQHVRVLSGDQVLYDDEIPSGTTYLNFPIPKECVQDGRLLLDFEYPDAVAPIDLGISTDVRVLSIAFEEILFTEQETTTELDFTVGGNADEYFVRGWYGLEDEQSWTNETASLLAILPAGEDQQMTVTYWTHPGAKDTAVYYNDSYIGTLPHHDTFAPERLVLPEKYRTDDDIQIITFVTDGAMTSKEYFGGDVTDERILGVALSEAVFSPANVLDRALSFTGPEAVTYFTDGATGVIEDGKLMWSLGKKGQAEFYVGDTDQDLHAHISLLDWMPGGAQHVIIKAQGRTLYDDTVVQQTPVIDFDIPNDCIRDGVLTLSFQYPDACSPKSIGASDDERVLGVAFQEILFESGETAPAGGTVS